MYYKFDVKDLSRVLGFKDMHYIMEQESCFFLLLDNIVIVGIV